jgi:hypothetical protein
MPFPGERYRGTAATVVFVLSLAAHAVIGALAWHDAPEPQGDFDRYYEIASGAGRPYVDYQVEHPIGTLIVFKVLAAVPGGRAAFGRGVVALNLLADAAIILALFRVWGGRAAAYYTIVTVPIASLLFHRIDLWSMAAATLAATAWRCRSGSLAALFLAAGASFKLWPLVLVFMLWYSVDRWRAVAVFALATGVLAVIAAVLAGPKAILEVLTFRSATGWQIESLAGSVIHFFTDAAVRTESGAERIGTVDRLTSIALFVAAAPLCAWASWRGFRARDPGAAWLGAVGSLLTLSALFSAQYVGWLAPGAALAWTTHHRRSAALTAVVIWLTALFMIGYDAVREGVPFMAGLVVLRNVVVVVLTLDALAGLARASPAEAHLQP